MYCCRGVNRSVVGVVRMGWRQQIGRVALKYLTNLCVYKKHSYLSHCYCYKLQLPQKHII